MSSKSILDVLFPQLRAEVLFALFHDPNRWWYLSALARHVGRSASNLQRELDGLSRAGLLIHRREGRQMYYRVNQQSPVFASLRIIIKQSAGIRATLTDAVAAFGNKIEIAFLHGPEAELILTGEEHTVHHINLLIVGSITEDELQPLFHQIHHRFGYTVYLTLLTEQDFDRKLIVQDGNLLFLLEDKRISLKQTTALKQSATCLPLLSLSTRAESQQEASLRDPRI
jgi:predicted transcriptional regulator with HTH domain